MQVDASRPKSAKPELAMGGQTDSKSARKFRQSQKAVIPRTYRWLVISLCQLALGGQTVKKVRRLAYEFELEQSQCKSSQNERKLKPCVDLRVRLARALYTIPSVIQKSLCETLVGCYSVQPSDLSWNLSCVVKLWKAATLCLLVMQSWNLSYLVKLCKAALRV